MSRHPTPGHHGRNEGRSEDDLPLMSCVDCREELSADLDGEADPTLTSRVQAHLTWCADCRAWRARAARVTRLTRTTTADSGPDLAVHVVQRAAPDPRRDLTPLWRGTLVAIGVLQLALGVVGLGPAPT